MSVLRMLCVDTRNIWLSLCACPRISALIRTHCDGKYVSHVPIYSHLHYTYLGITKDSQTIQQTACPSIASIYLPT